MEYCCHVWADPPSCYLESLDKLQKQICKTAGLSLAATLEPLAHHWNVANLKSDSYLPKKMCFFCFIESPLKMMKNAFYFILKAPFVLKIFKFLS